ncbi:MAG TPA: dsRBD fold-containing protein, partial [Acidimicrobiales bacterium]
EGDNHESLITPGSDMHVEAGAAEEYERVSMRVDISITEDADHCDATARVRVRDRDFSGWGRARRHPADPQMPLVGEELAVARALSDVSHQLVVAAADSLESALGRPVALHA